MKNNMLRAPLVKSAVLLAAFSLIIYLTVSSPEGSVWSSIGAIFYTVFKAAQLAVGLILALFVCLAVLVGIFFGCIAMVSTESAAKMYDHLRQFVRDKFHTVQSLFPIRDKLVTPDFIDDNSSFRAHELSKHVNTSLEDIRQAQKSIEEKVSNLQSRVEQNEQDESITKLSDWLRAEEEKTIEVQASLELIGRQVQQLQKQAEDMQEKLESISSVGSLNEVTGRVETLEKSNSDSLSGISMFQKKVDSLREELADLRKVTSAPEEIVEHRLFSYIENPQDKEKIQQLVAEALKQDMTYAQVTEHISQKITKKSVKVLTDHPTLTKEYIRECRKKK